MPRTVAVELRHRLVCLQPFASSGSRWRQLALPTAHCDLARVLPSLDISVPVDSMFVADPLVPFGLLRVAAGRFGSVVESDV